ncbi:hypothetical protein CYB_0383 [Synechococcus sp. JA-2-3B'a(2-13)]|nr:hypothetical protein CYB_0383 [Synechococcus sp. JA-2-3B'a(2-13)]
MANTGPVLRGQQYGDVISNGCNIQTKVIPEQK